MSTNYAGKHCIVTGGSGFIGQNLVRTLLERGAHVYVLDNFSYGAKRSTIHPHAHVYEGNVAAYASFSALPEKEYAYLFHFAAPSSVVFFQTAPEQCIQETIQGLQHAITYCSKRSIRLIFPSSGSLYAGTALPQKETNILNRETMNVYAQTKYDLEKIQRARDTTSNSIALRIFAGYGPSESHKGNAASVVYSFCKKMYNKERPVIFGTGEQERDFVYITDVVNATLELAGNCKESVVNIGSGNNVSFKTLVSTINTILGTSIEPVYVKKPSGYLEKTCADISLVKRYFKEPMTSLEYGIEHIMRSF